MLIGPIPRLGSTTGSPDTSAEMGTGPPSPNGHTCLARWRPASRGRKQFLTATVPLPSCPLRLGRCFGAKGGLEGGEKRVWSGSPQRNGVSCPAFCNRLLPTGGLKMTVRCPFTVLVARSPIATLAGLCSFRRENPGSSLPAWARGCVPPASASVVTWPSPLHLRGPP